MKLLNEQEVEEASNLFSETYWIQTPSYEKISCFQNGVEFAEQKLLQIIVEFIEWVDNMCWYKIKDGLWCDPLRDDEKEYTTEELLEQFIKTNQNEKINKNNI